MNAEIRRKVWERAKGRCEDCGTNRFGWRGPQFHHRVFRGMGGRRGTAQVKIEAADNILLLCPPCHSRAHGIKEV